MKKIAFFMCCLCAVMFMSCTKTTGTENGHEWVDLGLPSGTKWATCNVGASAPEEYGDHFSWGETTTKSTYGCDTYKWATFHKNTFINKYNTVAKYGTVDNKNTLEPADDAAYANWGGAWRMPTDAEWTELRTNCIWTWTTKDGVNGYEVEGDNGNSIFLPAAGSRDNVGLGGVGKHGYYWSSSLDTDFPISAWNMSFFRFDSDDVDRGNDDRCYGQSVRPVFK
ncbi:MAG: hypothetical protein ACI392_01750 [Paludibacteraceae bacterium]